MGHLAELASIALAQWRIEASIALARLAHSRAHTEPGRPHIPSSDVARGSDLRRWNRFGALALLGERLNRIQ